MCVFVGVLYSWHSSPLHSTALPLKAWCKWCSTIHQLTFLCLAQRHTNTHAHTPWLEVLSHSSWPECKIAISSWFCSQGKMMPHLHPPFPPFLSFSASLLSVFFGSNSYVSSPLFLLDTFLCSTVCWGCSPNIVCANVHSYVTEFSPWEWAAASWRSAFTSPPSALATAYKES